MRETILRIGGVERIVRTEYSGKVRTVAQLERAHTAAVKTAALAMRIAAAPDSMPRAEVERRARYQTSMPKSNWAEVTRKRRGPRPVDPRTYMHEVAPGHWTE